MADWSKVRESLERCCLLLQSQKIWAAAGYWLKGCEDRRGLALLSYAGWH
jgi:hypothetical protein